MKVPYDSISKRAIWDLVIVDDVRNCRKIVGYKDDEEWECPYYSHYDDFEKNIGVEQPWLLEENGRYSAWGAFLARCDVCCLLAARSAIKNQMENDPEYLKRRWKEEFTPKSEDESSHYPVVTFEQIHETLAKKAGDTNAGTDGEISETDEIENDLDCLDLTSSMWW